MMSASKPTRHAPLFSIFVFFFFLFISSFRLSYSVGNKTILCPEIEKLSLLNLKQYSISTEYFNNQLSSWDGEMNCCEWEGVICNDLTGHVHQLHLQHLGLSGKINSSLLNLKYLSYLELSDNYFFGETRVPSFIGSLAECFLEALENLYLKNNKLSGHLTYQLGEFKSLERLYLTNNSLSGVIPTSIGELSYLEELSLVGNNFTGTLPESLGQLFNLQYLFIGNNKLEGVVTEIHFLNLAKLLIFSAFRNNLTLKVTPNWNPPFQVYSLLMASRNLGSGSEIPSWIEKQKNILELDLSNTGISGSIPSWVWKIPFLNLSHNHLHGKIRIADNTEYLDLSNNLFYGGIYHLLCDVTSEFNPLTLLHLGGNQLSGALPDCWTNWRALGYLNLANNNMSGSIPNSIGFLEKLRSLKLYGNKLSGEMPFSMRNCTELRLMDLADNDLDGGIPKWVGTDVVKLRFLILRSNKLSGKISPEICLLKSLQILDLSDNKLSDIIPRCLSDLSAMATKRRLHGQDYIENFMEESALVVIKGSELEYGTTLDLVTNINLSKNNLSGNIPKGLTSLVELRSLNLSQNRLTGPIPAKIGDMKQLESLDFSMNSLSGHIPNSLALVSFLNYLNLSCNNLTGEIPKSVQLQSLDASSFNDNNLCGPPLTIKCNDDGDEGHEHKEENKEEDADDECKIEWLYVVVSLGYAVGLSGVLSALVLNKSWREAYFGLLKSVWDKFYVYVCIKYNKLSCREESG